LYFGLFGIAKLGKMIETMEDPEVGIEVVSGVVGEDVVIMEHQIEEESKADEVIVSGAEEDVVIMEQPIEEESEADVVILSGVEEAFGISEDNIEEKLEADEDIVNDQNGLASSEVDQDEEAAFPEQNILPDRFPSDFARDKKRILEICYGSDDDDDATPSLSNGDESLSSGNETKTDNDNINDEQTPTAPPGTKQVLINGKVINLNPLPQKKKLPIKKKKKKPKKENDEHAPTSSNSSREELEKKLEKVPPAETTENGDAPAPPSEIVEPNAASTDTTPTEYRKSSGKPRKRKKKRRKKKKKSKDEKPVERDAAGRVIRKQKYVKHRHKVVKKHLIKKGKEAKISLDPIEEVDDESASRMSYSSLISLMGSSSHHEGDDAIYRNGYLPNTLKEDVKSPNDEVEDEEISSTTSSEYSWSDDEDDFFTLKGIILLIFFVLVVVGTSVGLTVYFLNSEKIELIVPQITLSPTASSSPTFSPSTNPTPAPTVPPTSAPTMPTPEPTMATTAPTATMVPTSSPSDSKQPTSSLVPTLSPTTTAAKTKYLANLVQGFSPNYNSQHPQDVAFAWLTLRNDQILWLDLTDEELTERYIMAIIFFATNGNFWILREEWMSSSLHVCDWYGVECTKENLVSNLDLGTFIYS
jgi:hypothetical protein